MRALERRMRAFCIHDQVVALAIFGEVLLSVVDDVIKADRAHHLELPRAVDSGDFNVLQLGELDGNCAHAATRPIDQNFLTRF